MEPSRVNPHQLQYIGVHFPPQPRRPTPTTNLRVQHRSRLIVPFLRLVIQRFLILGSYSGPGENCVFSLHRDGYVLPRLNVSRFVLISAAVNLPECHYMFTFSIQCRSLKIWDVSHHNLPSCLNEPDVVGRDRILFRWSASLFRYIFRHWLSPYI